jgi:hypothetical protein
LNLHSFFADCRNDYKFSISDSIALVNQEHWKHLLQSGNVYLSIPYLQALEETLVKLDFRYVLVYNQQNKPIMAAYFQLVDFKDQNHDYANWLSNKFGQKVIEKVFKTLDMKILVGGNLFSCGENGFVALKDMDDNTVLDILNQSTQRIGKNLGSGEKATLYLLKEFWPNNKSFEMLEKESYSTLNLDCNMVLKLHPNWLSTEDYYSSMTSKFRTKANSIFQKSQQLAIEVWDEKTIAENAETIDVLHNNVLNNTDFNLGALNALTFVKLKENLKEQFIFKAYKLEQKVVGFSISILCHQFLDAAYVGIDYSINQTHALYHRMLHDFVQEGIALKSKEIRFGRTAEQIKSTLGAVPVQMKVFVRHRNKLTNKLIRPITENIQPGTFENRYPFKAEFNYN